MKLIAKYTINNADIIEAAIFELHSTICELLLLFLFFKVTKKYISPINTARFEIIAIIHNEFNNMV
jgi:hypothetical protein